MNTDERNVLQEHSIDADFGDLSGRESDDDDACTPGNVLRTSVEHVTADVFDDDVGAAAGRRATELFDPIASPIVDGHVGAGSSRDVELVAARERDDARTHGFRHL